MAPKRKQRNNFSNDSMANDSTAHSISNDKNSKENTSTPFLTQLFDSLSDSKVPSGNIISETLSPQYNDEMSCDINNKSNIKSSQSSTQTPFLSQLFNRISNSKVVLGNNDEHTELLTKTNSNDQSDSKVVKESDKNEITEPFISQFFQTESTNDVDKKYEIDDTGQLNSNMNDFKQNTKNAPDNEVKSVKNISPTPFLSQLFNALDKSSTFSGVLNAKPDHITSDESLRSQDSKGTSDDKDNASKKNLSPSLSQLLDTSYISSSPVEQSNKDTDHSLEKTSFETQNFEDNFQDKDEPSKTTSEAPFLSQLFNSLSSSSTSNQLKKEPNNFSFKESSDKLNSKVLSEDKMELAQKSAVPFLTQLFGVLGNSSISSGQLINNEVHKKTENDSSNQNIDLKMHSNSQNQGEGSKGTGNSSITCDQLIDNEINKNSENDNSNPSIDLKMHFNLQNQGESSKGVGSPSITSDQPIDNEMHTNLENDSSNPNIDLKMHSNSQNQDDHLKGNEKLTKEIDDAPFLSQLFDSISNKPTVKETSVRDVKCSSDKVQEQEKFLSNVKSSQKKEQNCFRFDRDFYLHQLEIADALEDGNLKEINENLTTGLVLAAKATGHLVGRIYEWIKKSYPNKSEIKLNEVAKQLHMMTKIIAYFDKTSFSKNEFEQWMTQLNYPYVFPANSKLLWSNVLKNDEFCYKIGPKFYERLNQNQIEIEQGEKEYFNSSKIIFPYSPFDRPCDQTNTTMSSGVNDRIGTGRKQFHGSIWESSDDKFDPSLDNSESPWNQSGPTWNQSYSSKDEYEPQRDVRLSRHDYGPQKEYKPQQYKLGPLWNESDPTRNEFCHSRDQFSPSRNNFVPPRDQFGLPSNSQGHLREDFAPPNNQCRPSMDLYDNSHNEFDHPKDQCGPARDQPVPNRDQFGHSRDEFDHTRTDFCPPRNEFDPLRDESCPPRNEFGSKRDLTKEQMGLSRNRDGPPHGQYESSQSEFCSSMEKCLPPQERFTPPGAPPSTLSIEYSHGQQQGPPLYQPLSNVPPQHMMPLPSGPPPNIGLPNISAPQMLGVLQTQQPSPFTIPPSNIPYDVPLPNFPPNGPHPPNVMPFSDIGQPPPIPQSLLQLQHPPQEFTQIKVAPPNTSYSNISVPEEWIKAQNLLKSKGDLPSCPPPSIPYLDLPPPTITCQNVLQTDTTHTIPKSISQYNQINASSASQITQDASTTTVSPSSKKKLKTSTQPTKKHKIDIKLKKKHHDENEESKKSVYICCLPRGLSNEMMKKLLLVCGEVEEFHREIIDGIEAESCVVKFREVETVFKSYHLLNEFMILDSMLIVAVLNEKLFSDEDKEIDEKEILESKSAIDLLKVDIEMEVMKQNTECSSSKRLLNDDDALSKKLKVDNDEEIYGPDCTDIEISNLNIDIGKILLVPVLEKCGGVVKWREKGDKMLFKYKNKQSAVIASQLLRELRIPDKYLQVNILSKEAENLESMEVDKGKKNTMKSWLNQAIVANQEEFVNHLQKFCAMYRSNDFDPFAYKTKMCLETKCTGNCESYHIPEKKDRRRDPRIYNYSDVECKNFRDGKSCPEGDMCYKSHTENEREFHESRIHTSICRNWETTKKKCDKKKLCISAHPETPEILFSEIWCDLYVSGLHQTYQYLEGSVHNLRNIKMEPGAMYVLVVSPSMFMVRWLTKAIRKLAGRHRLRVEEITEEKTAVDGATIVIGTPDGVLKMMTGSYHRSYELSNVTCLILDDASLLLHKYFKNMKNILSSVIKYSSKELNKIVVGENIFQSEVDTLSLLLETKFTVLGDILSDGGFTAPQDIKDEKKKEAKKQRHLSPEDNSYQDHLAGSRSPRFRSPRSRSPRSRSPRSRSPRSKSPRSKSPRSCYRDHSPGSPRTRYRNQSPCSPRFRYRDYSPDSPTSRYKEQSPNSLRSRYREHSPGSPRSRYKRHSPGSPRARYRENSPSNRSPRSRYRDVSPEKGGPSRSSVPEYPVRLRSRYPSNPSGIRGPSRYSYHFPKGRGRGGPAHHIPKVRGRGGPIHLIRPPMEINFPIVDHCYNLRSICDDLGLAGYTLRTIIVRALNLGPNPHKILQALRDADVLVQMNKEAAEFKLLEKRADNVISEENFKHAFIQTKMLIDYLKSTVHIGSVDQYGLNIRRIAIETLNKNIEYITDEVKIHLRSARVTPTPKNVFEILAAVLGEQSIINANRPKGSHHHNDTEMSSLDNVGFDVDTDLEMVNVKKAEPTVGIQSF